MSSILKMIKKKLKVLISYLNNHRISEIGFFNGDNKIQYSSLPIIDLSKNLEFKNSENLLCSYEGDSSFAASNEYPVIESWLKINKKSYGINETFIFEQFKKIDKIKNKNIKYIEEKVYLLPYYTSHFGHFAGDLLGQILFYIEKIKNEKDSRRICIITPSEKWSFFLKNFAHNKIFFLTPKEALNYNYSFLDAKIFPRMSNVQNYLLAKNILNNSINYEENSPKKIFITTNREDRISNIKELNSFLIKDNYKIIDPKNYQIKDLLCIIKSAKVLLSEKASVLNNVILIRENKFFILSSKTENNLTSRLFIGAGIYKEFHRGLYKEIFCEDDPPSQTVRAFKKRIKVDVNRLSQIINNEYN